MRGPNDFDRPLTPKEKVKKAEDLADVEAYWTQHPDASQGWSRHEAGQPFDCGLSNQNLDAVAAIVIPCGALPNTICISDDAASVFPGGSPVLSIELTK